MESIKPMKSTIEAAPLAGASVAVILMSLVLPGAQEAPSTSALTLTVPPGFVVERVAGPPLVDRPIVADFDDEGRLYVADSSGSNDRVEKQLADRPHRIVRLEDTNADGRFDKSVVFADKMMLPEGTMWLDGSLYVAAPPSIWKLTDTNGDGVADQREEWFQGQTLTGCANDLHGPYRGPDGWIYWTKGAFAQQTYERTPGPALVTRAAHILRRRPGDPTIEVVMTGGMDNPVDVAFTPTGERVSERDLPRTSAGWPARRVGSRHLRRRLREAACRPRRAQTDRRFDARALRAWARRSGRADSIRLACLRRRVSRQLFRGDVQSAQGDAPCAPAARRDVQESRRGLSRFGESRFSSNRRHRRRGWKPPRPRHGPLVQALLPHVAACQARSLRRDLSRSADGGNQTRRPPRSPDRVEHDDCGRADETARRWATRCAGEGAAAIRNDGRRCGARPEGRAEHVTLC